MYRCVVCTCVHVYMCVGGRVSIHMGMHMHACVYMTVHVCSVDLSINEPGDIPVNRVTHRL